MRIVVFISIVFTLFTLLGIYVFTRMEQAFPTSIMASKFVLVFYIFLLSSFFIGKFFAMKACNNQKFNYLQYYLKLKKLDDKLFIALNEFWEDWMTFDINDSFVEILDLFFDDMNKWVSNKIFN